MNEKEWVEEIATLLRPKLEREGAFKVETGHKLAYAFEVREYDQP
jgi:hypothetical protein